MILLFALLACAPKSNDAGSETAATDSATPSTGLADTSRQTPADTAVSTAGTGDTGMTWSVGSTGGTGSTADTGVAVFQCLDFAPADVIENIPIPTAACSFSPGVSSAYGISVDAAAVAAATLVGDDEKALGFSLHLLPDIDGNGHTELAVGAPGRVGFYGVDSAEGEVWLIDGSRLSGELRKEDVDTVLASRPANPLYPDYGDGGWLVSGDLLHDGGTQLVVDGLGYDPTFIVQLPQPSGEYFLEDIATASITPLGGHDLDYASVGDVDGDGGDDLVFTGWGASECFGQGGLSVYYGPISGHTDNLTPGPSATFDPTGLDAPSKGVCSGQYTPSVLWDIDGDGDDEVFIDGPGFPNMAPLTLTSPFDHGGFAIFNGGPQAYVTGADARLVVHGDCSGSIGSIDNGRIGDVTGDGHPDLAVSASTHAFADGIKRGAVFVVSELHRASGTVPLSAVSCAMVYGDNGGDTLWAAGPLGDLNGDGIDDLVVGASDAFGTGAVYIFLGPVQGEQPASNADLTLIGPGGNFGYRIAGNSDLTGDGIVDLVVGAHTYQESSTYYSDGHVYLFSGADLLALLP